MFRGYVVGRDKANERAYPFFAEVVDSAGCQTSTYFFFASYVWEIGLGTSRRARRRRRTRLNTFRGENRRGTP